MSVDVRYSAAFKEQAMNKVLSRGSRTIVSVAEELNMSVFTLKNWMKTKHRRQIKSLAPKERRPQEWSVEEQLVALHETHALEGEVLSAWCRERGLFPHHLASWHEGFCARDKDGVQGEQERRTLKEENQQLKRELARKEKALAEAGALLVLQKKFQALWEDEVK